MYLFIKHFLTRSQSAYSNSTLIQFSVPQEIQFILEKGGEILDSVGAEACEVLPALISLGVPGLWVWRWDRSLSPPPADNVLLSLDPPPKDRGDRTAVWRAVSVPWAKAIHTSENVSDLLWGTRSHNIKAIQPLHVHCLQKPRGQCQPPRAA